MKRKFIFLNGQCLEIQYTVQEQNWDLKGNLGSSDVTVHFESEEPIQLPELVYRAALRWKSGEMSVYLELVNLLLKQLILNSKITESIVNEVDRKRESTNESSDDVEEWLPMDENLKSTKDTDVQIGDEPEIIKVEPFIIKSEPDLEENSLTNCETEQKRGQDASGENADNHCNLKPNADNVSESNNKPKKVCDSAAKDTKCKECDKDLKSVDQLIGHVVANHVTRPDLLPRLTRTQGPLPWTRAEAWERGAWTCPVCPEHMIFRAENVNGMVSHVKLSHPTSLICWVCGKTWSDKQGKLVYEHMKEAHPLKSVFACEKCGVYNQSKKYLNYHKKIHRMEGLTGPLLRCDQCEYVTQRPDLLAKHRFSHRAGKSFMCGDCGKVLKSRTALATHSKLHTNDRSHKCSVCHKSFSQRGYLKTHMNSHSDSKPFSCEFCAMTFFGPTNLSQHRKRAHGDLIGESPQLTCSLCPKRFWIPSELRYHTQRVHEGRKDFACGQCSKRFADRKNLRKHMVTVHKTEEMSGLGGGFEARPMVGYKQM